MSSNKSAAFEPVIVIRAVGHRSGFIPLRCEEGTENVQKFILQRKRRDLSPVFGKIFKILKEMPEEDDHHQQKEGQGNEKKMDAGETSTGESGKELPYRSQISSSGTNDSWFEETWKKYEEVDVTPKGVSSGDMEVEDENELEQVDQKPVSARATESQSKSFFKQPQLKHFLCKQKEQEENPEPEQSEAVPQARNDCDNSTNTDKNKKYYGAVFGKASTRKHKVFQNDGYIVITGEAKIVLQDTTGKTIESSNNYKITPEMLEEGKVFKLGGKEIQIVERLKKKPYYD